MPKSIKHKLIAAFLLFMFSLSTIAGFACSIGLNFGDNTWHHNEATTCSGIHKHHNNSFQKNAAPVLKGATHSNDCCTNDVTSFNKLDKSVSGNNLSLKVPVLLLSTTLPFFSQKQSISKIVLNDQFHYIRRCALLYNPDIRIAIRSFLI